MKKAYTTPSMQMIDIKMDACLLAGSGETGSTVFTTEDAGSGVSGLSRRSGLWDDEEEEDF